MTDTHTHTLTESLAHTMPRTHTLILHRHRYICAYSPTNTDTPGHTDRRAHTLTHRHTRSYIHSQTQNHTLTHSHGHTRMLTRRHTYHTDAFSLSHTHTHVRTDTHAPSLSQPKRQRKRHGSTVKFPGAQWEPRTWGTGPSQGTFSCRSQVTLLKGQYALHF